MVANRRLPPGSLRCSRGWLRVNGRGVGPFRSAMSCTSSMSASSELAT